jgi:hypothetical protein
MICLKPAVPRSTSTFANLRLRALKQPLLCVSHFSIQIETAALLRATDQFPVVNHRALPLRVVKSPTSPPLWGASCLFYDR